jgi:hypothetical protein
MVDPSHLVADDGLDPKFLFQLPPQGVAGLLTLFDLASGKLPLERHDLVPGPLAGEDLVLLRDECGDDAFHESRENQATSYEP